MSRAFLALALCLAGAMMQPALAEEPACPTAMPLALRVRFAGEPPRDAQLAATSGGLQLTDAATGMQLWSIELAATFSSSLAAVHLDEDGLHDRVYAGDHAGRLWRFDLRADVRRASWAEATVLADLGAPGGGRGFIAAPDITRIANEDGNSWLNIAVGTANTSMQRPDHRFYVLRDGLDGRPPSSPLVEADLQAVRPPAIASGNVSGYYLDLGGAQVLARALTLDGRIHFTVVESALRLVAGCADAAPPSLPMSVIVLRAADGAVPDRNDDGHVDQHDLRRTLPRAMPASAAVELAGTVSPDGRLPCQIGAEPLPECFLDTRPRRTWWRREDAD